MGSKKKAKFIYTLKEMNGVIERHNEKMSQLTSENNRLREENRLFSDKFYMAAKKADKLEARIDFLLNLCEMLFKRNEVTK